MSLTLLCKVPTSAIETLFNEQKQTLFKKAHSGEYLNIGKTKANFKDFPSHYICIRSEIIFNQRLAWHVWKYKSST